jgi:hypothetical protein
MGNPTLPGTPEQTERLLAIGGPRHTETMTVGVSQGEVVDLATASRYIRRTIGHGKPDPVTGEPTDLWFRWVLVHESIISDQQAVQAHLGDALLAQWVRRPGGVQADPKTGKPLDPAAVAAGTSTTEGPNT